MNLLNVATLLFLLVLAPSTRAETCVATSSVCSDDSPCKTIAGRNVCLADIGEQCWKYDKTYTCYPASPIDECTQPKDLGTCAQYSSVCKETNPATGECSLYTNKFDCPTPISAPLATGLIDLGQEFEILRDELNTSACEPFRTNATCWKDTGPTCLEPAETRTINGLDVTKTCWKYEEVYICEADGGIVETSCTTLIEDPACKEIDTSICVAKLPNGTCSHYERTFSCVTVPGTTTTTSDCSDQKFCMDLGGGSKMCFKSGSPADKDFGATVTSLELARQMGAYMDPGSSTFFRGVSDSCRYGFFGLRSCCKTETTSGTSNSAALRGTMAFASAAGDEFVQFMGSSYMHDLLFSSDLVPLQNLSSIYSGGGGSYAFLSGNFSVYGLEFTYSAAQGVSFVGFDPYSFALSVAIYVVTELMSCEPAEQTLAMRRGVGLCHYVGSYCSQKSLGTCVERKQTHCCYNSKLAKLIAEQGRDQLGIDWGTPKAPNCEGFSVEQIEALDFSTMDFSEFIAEIAGRSPANDAAKARLTGQMTNYYTSGTTTLNSDYYSSGTGLPK